MPASKAKKKSGKSKPARKTSKSAPSRLDIVFSGPLLFVPNTIEGSIHSVEVYSPKNGHPVGAVFIPNTFFTDTQLNHPDSPGWPEISSFSLLDPHSYAIHLVQSGQQLAFTASSIPAENHKVKPGRRLSADWEIAAVVHGQLSSWTSHLQFDVTEGLYQGSDAPTSKKVSCMHRLTYLGVTGAEFSGVAAEPKKYLSDNILAGGTLIILGEIPYQPSLLHERQAVQSLAKLAGLDLHLMSGTPSPGKTRLMASRSSPCGHSVVLVEPN
jgi:hypothetical protein